MPSPWNRVLFVQTVVIPATETTPVVEYLEGLWYDGVPDDHLAQAGDAAEPLRAAASCNGKHWVTHGNMAVYSRSEDFQDRDPTSGKACVSTRVKTFVVPHQSICEQGGE
jgi:hypothetical protein